MDLRIFEEPKIDCHVHVLDPARFPYGANTHYRPMGQEMGTPAQLAQVMEAYGTRRALLVGPNSGYGLDNSCMLDTIARAPERYRGIAVVANDASVEQLRQLKTAGVLGVAWNVTFYGLDYYRDAAPLLEKLKTLDMFVDIQVEHDQLVAMMPLLGASGAAMMFAAQKGASPGEVRRLEAAMSRLAAIAATVDTRDLAELPGSGAAGGCGFALALAGARLLDGAGLVCDAAGLDGAFTGAALVITGEGQIDAQTATGKAPAEVAVRARRAGIPCAAIGGVVVDPLPELFSLTLALGAFGEAMDPRRHARALLRRASRQAVRDALDARGGSPE